MFWEYWGIFLKLCFFLLGVWGFVLVCIHTQKHGTSPLQFETFIRVCYALQVMPSAVMATAERYATLLSQSGWGVLSSELDVSDDGLLSQAQEYWALSSSRNVLPNFSGVTSVLNGPIYNMDNTITLAPVFQYVLDANFRKNEQSRVVL